MISKEFRFHGHNSLTFVYRKGRTVRTEHCAMKFVANNRRSSYRVAVVVSKKLSKSAVVRNRIRRRIYEQVRGLVVPAAGYDIVITAYNDKLATMSEKDIKATIMRLMQVSGIGQGQEDRGLVDNSPRVQDVAKNI